MGRIMLRRLFAALLIMPFAVPPGMCLCHAGAMQEPGSGQRPAAGDCCEHTGLCPAHADCDTPASPVPNRTPKGHVPGCPTANGAAPFRQAKVGSADLLIALEHEPQPTYVTLPIRGCSPAPCLEDAANSALPLYLALRTLLI